jgi:5S rRNA maturation endonuclease (ribonuclease M5)
MKKEALFSHLDFGTFYKNLIPSLREKNKKEAMGLCPFHEDRSPSLYVNLENGLYHCFACGAGGDALKFYKDLKGVDFIIALKEIRKMIGIGETPIKSKKVVATFEYKNSEGKTLYFKERIEPGEGGRSKEFRFKHSENGQWVFSRGYNSIPYNLSEIKNSKYAVIVEGEGKVDLLKQWGLVGSCLDSGADSPWKEEYQKVFEGKEIIILPDNDVPGKSYAYRIANALNGKAGKIKIVDLPGLKDGQDIIDWSGIHGNDKTKLSELIKTSPEWIPEKEPEILSYLESWSYIQGLDVKVEWVVDRLIPKESITVVFGKGGIGKTWLMLDLGRCIANGISFLGLATIKMPVIFVDFENPVAVLNDKTRKLGNGEKFYFWRAHNDKLPPPRLDAKNWGLFKSLPRGAVLIFDTLRASQSKDENASDDMGEIMGRLKELRDMGFTIILIHHTAKNSDKVPKGSTAIVDLADHILGMTLVKKKNDGQDIVVEDDEEFDEEKVYRFGARGKTRFEPYYIYLTLNPDRGFDLAPDPQEDILKEMHRILEKHGTLSKTAFLDACKELGMGEKKTRKMFGIGQGRYWTVQDIKAKNAKLVTAIQFGSSAPLYSAAKLPNCPEPNGGLGNDPAKLDIRDSPKCLDNTEFGSSAKGICQTEKLDSKRGKAVDDLREGEL